MPAKLSDSTVRYEFVIRYLIILRDELLALGLPPHDWDAARAHAKDRLRMWEDGAVDPVLDGMGPIFADDDE